MTTAEGTVVPLRPSEESRTQIITRQFGANFAKGLIQAQRKIQKLAKDGYNKHHQYAYTSAEAMIEAASDALNEHGLGCLNTGWYREGGRVFVKYTVLHESGEFIEGETSTPVLPGNGRPEDKAEFGAITENLAYFLRGLCLIPRGGEDVPSGRDDRDFKPGQQQGRQQQRPPEQTAPPTAEAEAERRLAALLTDKDIASRFDQLNATPQRRRTTVESYGLDKAKVIAALDQAIAKKQTPAEQKPAEPASPPPAEQKPSQPAPKPSTQQKPPARPAVNPADIPF